MTSALSSLLGYFSPLASQIYDDNGTVTLLTPETNILALNATYVGDECPAHPRSPLLLSSQVRPGEDVGGLRVGIYRPRAAPSAVVVEQVSRLQLPVWAQVLAQAYDTPGWGEPIARHLGSKLESDPQSVLLLAYADSEAVGALLLRENSAHLWGRLDARVDGPLLNAAAELAASPLLVSVPDGPDVELLLPEALTFTLTELL